MRRISSILTKPWKAFGLAVSLLTPFAFAFFLLDHQTAAATIAAAMGLPMSVIWYRYVRRCSDVFLADDGLSFRSRGMTGFVPFSSILGVRTVSFIRWPPIVVTYSAAGSTKELVFVPSYRLDGLFGVSKLKRLLLEKIGLTVSPRLPI